MFIAEDHLIAENPPHPGQGVSVTDVDGDGSFEFLVTGYGVANRALKWTGSRLEDLAIPSLTDPSGLTLTLIAGDLDGDGREEVYASNHQTPGHSSQPDRLFAPFGSHWLDLLAQPENAAIADGAAGRAAACVDRLGRGRYGFAVANAGLPFSLYELDPRGRLIDVAEEIGIDPVSSARSILALPLISDRTDLFVHNDGAANLLFRNLGDGTYEEVAQRRGLTDPRQLGRGVAVLDADGNGLLDLACGVWQGSHRLFLQRAGGGFTDCAPADLSVPSHVCSVIAADFDNDGLEELLFLNHGQPNRLFGLRHDEWREIELGDAAEPRGLNTGAAVADIDGDGLLELLVNHGDGVAQPLSFYRASPNDNGWLRIMPLTPAGAPARGALVLCRTGGRVQHRAICAGSGYYSQMEPVAHFGLGDAKRVDQVEIRWPDGTVVTIDSPPIGRLIPVPHPPV
jgi:hypothetical protein